MNPYSPTVFDDLEAEWERLLASRQLDRALTRWHNTNGDAFAEFATPTDLLELLEDRTADPERQSAVLLALLRLAPTDQLAARLVLHRFTPPLKTIAGWRQPHRQADWAAQVITAGWEVIVTYPVERRPGRVAANIIWEVRKRMYRALSQHRRWQAELSDTDIDERPPTVQVADVGTGVAEVEALEMLRWAAECACVSAKEAQLIVLTRVAGFSLDEVAATARVPSSRLRQRRWRTEHRMRDVLAAAS